MAFKGEVKPYGEEKYYQNMLVFETEEEAEKYTKDLFLRWTMVDKWRVVEVDEPVNYRWDNELHDAVRLEEWHG